MARDVLLRRIETEARAYANADHTMDKLRLGRVLGLLEGGTIAGYWRKRDADAAAELIRNRYKLSRIRDVLLKAERVELMKATDVAAFLGVSYQRVQQLAAGGRLPKPSARSGRSRLWERGAIEQWAQDEWWGGRRWRTRSD